MKPRPWMFAVVAGAVVLTGCVDKRKPAESAPPARPQPAPAQPSPAAKPVEKKPADASFGGYVQNLSNSEKTAARTADLAALNKAVQQFGALEGRLPQGLDELVTKKYIPVLPAAPRGQRLVYDPGTGVVSVAPLP